jgi:hypothetical protein
MEVPVSLFFIVFTGFAAYFIYRFVKHGGFRGAMYGSAVMRTVGEVELDRYLGAHTTLRVHVLANGRIVLEESRRQLLAASMRGTTLTRAETDQLIGLLQLARG